MDAAQVVLGLCFQNVVSMLSSSMRKDHIR